MCCAFCARVLFFLGRAIAGWAHAWRGFRVLGLRTNVMSAEYSILEYEELVPYGLLFITTCSLNPYNIAAAYLYNLLT